MKASMKNVWKFRCFVLLKKVISLTNFEILYDCTGFWRIQHGKMLNVQNTDVVLKVSSFCNCLNSVFAKFL